MVLLLDGLEAIAPSLLDEGHNFESGRHIDANTSLENKRNAGEPEENGADSLVRQANENDRDHLANANKVQHDLCDIDLHGVQRPSETEENELAECECKAGHSRRIDFCVRSLVTIAVIFLPRIL